MSHRRVAPEERCQARVQTEWGTRCQRKATTIVNGVQVCAQHAKVDLDLGRDVVPLRGT